MKNAARVADAEVIVVGAGVFGASIADRLSAYGHQVLMIERNEPGGVDTPSGALERISRCAHGSDRFLAQLAWRARSLWIELGRDLSEPLFVESGSLTFVPHGDHGWVAAAMSTLKELDIPVQWHEREKMAELFPRFCSNDLLGAIFEPHAGLVRGRKAVHALVDRARSNGAELVRGEANPLGDNGVCVNGTDIVGQHVVWACGSELGSLFPRLTNLVTRYQDVVYLATPPDWDTASIPAWVDRAVPAYGHPKLDGGSSEVKLVPDVDRSQPDTEPLAAVEATLKYAAQRFPGLTAVSTTDRSICHYTATPDEDFVIDRHPQHPATLLVGGDSGYGFKHGPAIGEYVAGLVEGKVELLPRFSLLSRGLWLPDPLVSAS